MKLLSQTDIRNPLRYLLYLISNENRLETTDPHEVVSSLVLLRFATSESVSE